MKLRLTLLVLAVALLVAPLAGFAEPLTSTAPAACAAQASAPASILDPVTLKIVPASFLIPKCGACSLAPCVGATVNSKCGIGAGGRVKLCAEVGVCSQDSLTQCQCQVGPPV